MASDEFSKSDASATGGPSSEQSTTAASNQYLDNLRQQEADLKRSVAELQANYNRILANQAQSLQTDLTRIIQESIAESEQRRRTLQLEVEKLERRRERIQAEMRTSFAGVSQDLAIRVKGFKDYLVGSLQDLVAAAEELELQPPRDESATAPDSRRTQEASLSEAAPEAPPSFGTQKFQDQTERIRSLLDQYRMRPDYYGPVWQLRRTFEPVHADRTANWFFVQGGRGAIKSMGSRLQNVLIASAAISILYTLYGNRLRVLVLSNTPERLGEWRRGLQDCLGVTRNDFGTGRGVMLFDAPEPLAQRAERVASADGLPLIIIDEAEDKISLSLLQFTLWLAFAPDPMNPVREYDY